MDRYLQQAWPLLNQVATVLVFSINSILKFRTDEVNNPKKELTLSKFEHIALKITIVVLWMHYVLQDSARIKIQPTNWMI